MKIQVTMVGGPLRKTLSFEAVCDLFQVSGAGKDMLWRAFRNVGTTVNVPMSDTGNIVELKRVA